jgi:hypothetical protein
MAALLESQNKPGIQFLGARMSLFFRVLPSLVEKRVFGNEEDGRQKEKKPHVLSRLISELMNGFPV